MPAFLWSFDYDSLSAMILCQMFGFGSVNQSLA